MLDAKNSKKRIDARSPAAGNEGRQRVRTDWEELVHWAIQHNDRPTHLLSPVAGNHLYAHRKMLSRRERNTE